MSKHRTRLMLACTLVAGAAIAAYQLGPNRSAEAQGGAVRIGVQAVVAEDAAGVATDAVRQLKPIATMDISLEQAQAVIEAAAKKSWEIGTSMDIAVVDAGGNLKAFIRQDGAWLGSIDIAIKKAKTARYFDMNTGEIGKLSKESGPLYNIEHSNGGLITFPGGVPIKLADGTIIGAIGVSGSTVENDHAVAAAGAAVIK